MSSMQELKETLDSISLEERALMALYLDENPSADISDLIYSSSWNRNYREWVEWKKGERKTFKMKHRHWVYKKKNGQEFDIYNQDDLQRRVYIDAMTQDQVRKAYDDFTRSALMNDGDEVDLGYANVSFKNENRKSKGMKWSAKVKNALKRKG